MCGRTVVVVAHLLPDAPRGAVGHQERRGGERRGGERKREERRRR